MGQQKASYFCTRISFARDGGSNVGLSVFTPILLMFATKWSLLRLVLCEVLAFLIWSMNKSSFISSKGFASLPTEESCDSASVVCCFIPAR